MWIGCVYKSISNFVCFYYNYSLGFICVLKQTIDCCLDKFYAVIANDYYFHQNVTGCLCTKIENRKILPLCGSSEQSRNQSAFMKI